MSHKCYVMRGLPGSGKSSLAKSLNPMAVICSSDDYFLWNRGGVYDFRIAELKEAHRICQEKFRHLIDLAWPVVVVDNTNTTAWECAPYVQYAFWHGYDVELVEPLTPWAWDLDVLAQKNVHSVPREALERMAKRYMHGLTVEQIMWWESDPDTKPVGPGDHNAAWEAQQCRK